MILATLKQMFLDVGKVLFFVVIGPLIFLGAASMVAALLDFFPQIHVCGYWVAPGRALWVALIAYGLDVWIRKAMAKAKKEKR